MVVIVVANAAAFCTSAAASAVWRRVRGRGVVDFGPARRPHGLVHLALRCQRNSKRAHGGARQQLFLDGVQVALLAVALVKHSLSRINLQAAEQGVVKGLERLDFPEHAEGGVQDRLHLGVRL
jgi:hypothetical protein